MHGIKSVLCATGVQYTGMLWLIAWGERFGSADGLRWSSECTHAQTCTHSCTEHQQLYLVHVLCVYTIASASTCMLLPPWPEQTCSDTGPDDNLWCFALVHLLMCFEMIVIRHLHCSCACGGC